MASADVTLSYTGWKASDANEALFRRAAEEVIGPQVDSGVDLPTDGEVRRENYIHYHCRHIAGHDFRDLERCLLRDGACEAERPAIRGQVSHEGPAYSPHDFIASQEVTAREVEFTLPGPLTITDTTAGLPL